MMPAEPVCLIHGSRANRSPRRLRDPLHATSLYDRGVVYPGGAAAVRQNMVLRPLYLVRGAGRHGGNDFRVGHERPYEVGVPD